LKRSGLVLALLLSLGVNVGLLGAAFLRQRSLPRWHDARDAGHDPGERLAERLRLEGETRERFLAEQRGLAETVRELRPRIGRAEHAMRAELVARSPDRARIDSIREELAAARGELELAFAESVLRTREILEGRAESEYLRFVERFPGGRRGFADDRRPPRFGAGAPGRGGDGEAHDRPRRD
jgi:Spy/CpxP family protein refolding chaperone